jgi:predicted transcriptional regulator
MTLKKEAVELQQNGYSLDEIAEELGISTSKTRELIGNDEMANEMPKEKSGKFARQRHLQLQNRALNDLKSGFDEIVEQIQELNQEDDISLENGLELLEEVRNLELEFRKVARQFDWEVDNSEHRDALLTLITELKAKIKEWKEIIGDEEADDYAFELELEEELLEQLDDLRFELVSFEEE